MLAHNSSTFVWVRSIIALNYEQIENLMTKVISRSQISLAGEFAVLSQLSLRGFDANLTLGNTKNVDILIRAMLMDSRNTRKKDLYNSLMKRDEDVNRLTILANRVVNYYLEHPEKIKPEESLRDIVRFNIISDHMERLADESKRIARILRVLKAPKKFTDKIDSIYQTIEKTYSKIMQSFYQKDNNLAFQSSKAVREKITKICANLYDETKNKESVIVLEKFKTMANHIKVIGRAIYD